jgi:hypothetical protein
MSRRSELRIVISTRLLYDPLLYQSPRRKRQRKKEMDLVLKRLDTQASRMLLSNFGKFVTIYLGFLCWLRRCFWDIAQLALQMHGTGGGS